jgi:DNA-binding transcriptional ArsR family regulator
LGPEIENIDDAAYVRALAHPLRLRILAMLSERASSPARLAAQLGVRVNVAAYHVKRLHQLGLAEPVEVRRGRGGLEHFYAVRGRPSFTDEAWEALDRDARRRLLAAMLRQIGDYVNRAAVAGGFERRSASMRPDGRHSPLPRATGSEPSTRSRPRSPNADPRRSSTPAS